MDQEPSSFESSSGLFDLRVQLGPGSNTLLIEARDASGKSGSLTVKLRRMEYPAWFANLGPRESPPLPLPAGLYPAQEKGDYVNEKDQSFLRWIPRGEFLMGSEALGDDEKPVQRVTFQSGFFMSKFEVTHAQFRAYCIATGSSMRQRSIGGGEGERFRAPSDHPAFNVSWTEAVGYCNWAGLRLPSEAEWEFSARGPKSTLYPWGNANPIATRLNIADQSATWAKSERKLAPWNDGFPFTAPVGSFPEGASEFGCHDMAGNVREWVEDSYDKYYTASICNGQPALDPATSMKVNRGGGWRDSLAAANSAERRFADCEIRSPLLGFRGCRDAD